MRNSFSGWLVVALAVGGLAALPDTASARKKRPAVKPVAAAMTGTTDIADCTKMEVAKRDACISRSRPVRGAELYKKWGTVAAAAVPAAAKAAVAPKAAEKAPAAPAKAGVKPLPRVTGIGDCAKVDASQRDACISRSAPVRGPDLYKKYGIAPAAAVPTSTPAVPAPKAAIVKEAPTAKTIAKAVAPAKEALAPAKAAPAASKAVQLPKVTTLADCAKVEAAQRDACISRSAPVRPKQ